LRDSESKNIFQVDNISKGGLGLSVSFTDNNLASTFKVGSNIDLSVDFESFGALEVRARVAWIAPLSQHSAITIGLEVLQPIPGWKLAVEKQIQLQNLDLKGQFINPKGSAGGSSNVN
jgi:Tfp pilus assembly protein PilZ